MSGLFGFTDCDQGQRAHVRRPSTQIQSIHKRFFEYRKIRHRVDSRHYKAIMHVLTLPNWPHGMTAKSANASPGEYSEGSLT